MVWMLVLSPLLLLIPIVLIFQRKKRRRINHSQLNANLADKHKYETIYTTHERNQWNHHI